MAGALLTETGGLPEGGGRCRGSCARRTDSNFQRPLLHGQKGPKRLEAVAECFINEQTWGRLHDLPAETLTGAALPPSPARVGHLCEYPRLCPGWSSHSRAGLF